jgi:hypothetical protein
MRIALDCEFNGFGGELISMALVAEDGREFYLVLPRPDIIDPWVNEHVCPVLGQGDVSKEVFRHLFNLYLRQFLEEGEDITIVADWYTDLVHFFQVFAGRDHTESFHIPCTAVLLPDMEFLPSAVPHNALEDARAIMATLKARAA